MKFIFKLLVVFTFSFNALAGNFSDFHEALKRKAPDIELDQKQAILGNSKKVSGTEAIQLLLPAAKTLDPFIMDALARHYGAKKQWDHAYRWMIFALELYDFHAKTTNNPNYGIAYEKASGFLNQNKAALKKTIKIANSTWKQFSKVNFANINWANYGVDLIKK